MVMHSVGPTRAGYENNTMHSTADKCNWEKETNVKVQKRLNKLLSSACSDRCCSENCLVISILSCSISHRKCSS